MTILRSRREIKVMLKRRYSVLVDKDFEFDEGKEETMLVKLAEKLQKTRKELEEIFANLQKE